MDLIGLAEQAIKDLGADRRKRPDLASLKISFSDMDWEPDLSQAQPNAPQTFQSVFTELRDAADVALKSTVTRINSSIDKMGAYMRVADEELQMLWWLLGERSLDLNLPFDKVDQTMQPLVFARELVDRTASSPGPLALSALLSRAGLKSRGKLAVVAAVNAVSEQWAAKAIETVSASPITTPIHYALEKRVETGDPEAWAKSWAAVTGLGEDEAVPPLELGELFYRERLFLKYQ
ncbi:GTPase-associated system all-helical protein GASH [Bradyrhizobium septentrionale]|uniref:GTPase-associated system all-helical protein GASH n=1 Tax=Bradyrhizobium septentrionale TaxID=1404411 RepID=UPI0030CE78E0